MMAHEGQHIANPRSGQEMTFAELRKELLRIASVNPPTDLREPAHIHPKQVSGAEVTSGSLMFEVDGQQRRLGPGDSIEIPPGTVHRFWTEGSEPAHSVQFFRPALDIATFFETMFALAERDEIGDDGMPSLLQLAVMVPRFGDEIRPASPPWPLLRVLTTALGPVARARGYEATVSAGNRG